MAVQRSVTRWVGSCKGFYDHQPVGSALTVFWWRVGVFDRVRVTAYRNRPALQNTGT